MVIVPPNGSAVTMLNEIVTLASLALAILSLNWIVNVGDPTGPPIAPVAVAGVVSPLIDIDIPDGFDAVGRPIVAPLIVMVYVVDGFS